MPSLKLVRGTVKDVKNSTVSRVQQYGTGKDASVGTVTTDYTDVWLDVNGRDVPLQAQVYMRFLPGHMATCVTRDREPIFLLNESTGEHTFVVDRLVPWQLPIMTITLLLFVAGMLGLMLVMGGAPIGHYVSAMMLSPFVAGFMVWRAQRQTKAEVRQMVEWADI